MGYKTISNLSNTNLRSPLRQQLNCVDRYVISGISLFCSLVFNWPRTITFSLVANLFNFVHFSILKINMEFENNEIQTSPEAEKSQGACLVCIPTT